MAAGRFSVEAVFKGIDKITAPVSRMQNRIGKFTRGVARGLRKVNKMFGAMARGLRGAASQALKFGGVAIIAGITATTLALNRAADAADELAKRSRRLQFPIEDLQQWQFVAEQSGLSTEQFDKSIEKFTKTVGEARAGTGTMYTLLKKSNPILLEQITTAEDAAGAFDIYLSALRGTENQMDKTALATAAFGRTGAKFLNITEQSEEAIKALRLEMVQNGVITKEQAAGAEAYNDAVNSLKKSLFGMLNNVLLPMLPAITTTVRKWRELVVTNKDLVRVKVMEFLQRIKPAVLEVVDTIKRLNAEGNILARLGAVVRGIAKAFVFMARHGETILKVTVALVGMTLALKAIGAAMAIVNIVMTANPIGLIVVGVAALIAGLVLMVKHWDKVKAAMLPVLELLKNSPIGMAVQLLGKAAGVGFKGLKAVGAAVGLRRTPEETPRPQEERQIISPQDRMVRQIEASSHISKTELRIKDETGRAEIQGSPGSGTRFALARSGGFS